MTDWKAKYLESELARARAVEALVFYANQQSWEWTTHETTFDGCGCTDFTQEKHPNGPVQVGGRRARKALSAQPENSVADTLRGVVSIIDKFADLEVVYGLEFSMKTSPEKREYSESVSKPLKEAAQKLRALMGEKPSA